MTGNSSSRSRDIFLKEIFFLLIPFIAFAPTLLKGECFFSNDLLGQFGPWWAFFKDSLAHGVFPLWNPYNFAGQPFAADPQSFAFYPFFYPFLLLPIGWGLTAFLGFHFYLAARGLGKWLEAMGASTPAQCLGGALFAFSGLFRVELIHPTIIASLGWMPWCFAYLEYTFQKRKPREVFVLSSAYSMLFLCGSIQMTLAAAYGLLCYGFTRLLLDGHRQARVSLKNTKPYFLAALGGLTPILLASLPIGEFVVHCSRGVQPHLYETFNSRGSLNPHQWRMFLWPPSPENQPLGDAIQRMDASGDNPLQALSGFLGPVAILLALWGLFRLPFRITIPTVFVLLGGYIESLGRHTPLHAWSCQLLPGLSLVQMPVRFICLFTLAFSLLAGLGIQNLIARFGSIRPWKNPLLFSGILFVFCTSIPLSVGWNFYVAGPVQNFNFPKNSFFIKDLVLPTPPSRVFFTMSLPYRVWYDSQEFCSSFPINSCAVQKIRSVTAYNPLCLESYQTIQQLPLDRFARIFSAPLIVSQNPLTLSESFHPVQTNPSFTYELSPPTEAVKFPEHIEVMPNTRSAFERLQDPQFNVEKECVVTLPNKNPFAADGSSDGFASKCIVETPQQQSFDLTAPRDGLAVFPDMMFPGWKARLDGQAVPIYIAQTALRSVAVPKGNHRLVFSYHPFWWPWVWFAIALWFVVAFYKIFSTNKKTLVEP
jgi:hypothetical protein